MSKRVQLLFTLCLAAFVAASPVHAQGSIEIGGFGTYTRFDESVGLTDGGGGGARLSLFSGSGWTTFVLEAEGAFAQSKGTPTIRFIPARARLLYAVPVGEMASVLLGGGGVRNDFNDGTSSASEWGYTGMVGFRLRLGSYMALRVDGVYDYIANPINEGVGGVEKTVNQHIQAGLQFPLWTDRRVPERREPVAVPVPETRPEPVREPMPEQPRPEPKPEQPAPGPDADRDGVPDAQDACSATPAGATVDRDGCSVYRDTDWDGIIDPRDACPATPTGSEVDGRGCLLEKDGDRDGIADKGDRCPNTPVGERIDANGCTIVVKVDEPPPPPPPAPRPMERTVTLRGVTFASGRAELTQSSHSVLDELARQLVQASSIRLEIGGHTDSQGSHTLNVRLSLARAESVRAYLVMRGVPADRLVARGYGPDQPIATNATPAGRAMNRRVELRRIE